MKIVSENSEQDVQAFRAAEEAATAAAALTANLLRIVRGAGRPADLPAQLRELSTAMDRHLELTGAWPAEVVLAALRPGQLAAEETSRSERDLAPEAVVSGALQYVASGILDQRAQMAAGERELTAAIDELSRLRAETRLEAKRAMRNARKPKSRTAPKRKLPT